MIVGTGHEYIGNAFHKLNQTQLYYSLKYTVKRNKGRKLSLYIVDDRWKKITNVDVSVWHI